MRFKLKCGLTALAISAVAASAATATTLRPDEATSKDAFIYAFAIPDIFGIPGPSDDNNFDTDNIPATSIAPFGNFLGAAQTTPFRNDPSDPNEPLREHTTNSLIEFDLTSLSLTSAGLASAFAEFTGVGSLGAFDDPSATSPVTVNLRPVLEMWDEKTVTWNTRPMVGDVAASFTMTSGTDIARFDITDLVGGWLDDPSTNFGFELSADGISQQANGRFTGGLFGSSAMMDVNARPALVVSAVPLPGALPLLGGGFAAFAALRMRRKKAQ